MVFHPKRTVISYKRQQRLLCFVNSYRSFIYWPASKLRIKSEVKAESLPWFHFVMLRQWMLRSKHRMSRCPTGMHVLFLSVKWFYLIEQFLLFCMVSRLNQSTVARFNTLWMFRCCWISRGAYNKIKALAVPKRPRNIKNTKQMSSFISVMSHTLYAKWIKHTIPGTFYVTKPSCLDNFGLIAGHARWKCVF